jgi:hypothetical protein
MHSPRTLRSLRIGAAARRARGLGQVARRRVEGSALVCEALAGRSNYSVVVSSDLTNPIFAASIRSHAGRLDPLGRRAPGGLSVVFDSSATSDPTV